MKREPWVLESQMGKEGVQKKEMNHDERLMQGSPEPLRIVLLMMVKTNKKFSRLEVMP